MFLTLNTPYIETAQIMRGRMRGEKRGEKRGKKEWLCAVLSNRSTSGFFWILCQFIFVDFGRGLDDLSLTLIVSCDVVEKIQ